MTQILSQNWTKFDELEIKLYLIIEKYFRERLFILKLKVEENAHLINLFEM